MNPWLALPISWAFVLGCGAPRSDEAAAPGAAGATAAAPRVTGSDRSAARAPVTFSFEDARAGTIPLGFQVAATKGDGRLATWQVTTQGPARSGRQVLALTRTNHASESAFNLCWTDRASMRDGVIEVALQLRGGRADQGGGVMWRVQGPDDYYLCRANPLEGNFRVYVVKGGERAQLASADLVIAPGAWHVIRIEHVGDRIECALDGQRLLVTTDGALPAAGGVGVWTKADALTAFDDLTVAPRE